MAAPALAQDMAEYRPLFEALPALPPIPAGSPLTEARIALGQMLFFEPRISGSGVISCATCHNPYHGFAEPLASAIGKSELVVFEHLSHCGLHEDPETFNRVTLDFLLRQR